MVYLALGPRLFEKCLTTKTKKKEIFYKILVFLLTYLTYLAYHIAKRPIAVVENSSKFLDCYEEELNHTLYTETNATCHYSWVNEMNGVSKEKADSIIGNMQTFYAAFYAGFMFVAGWIAERMDLRYYLTFGLLLTATADFLFGFARTLGIHSVGYFYFVMAFLGIVNSTGWPGVVPTLSNWLGKSGFGTLFGKSTRGLLMGVWNTHQYVGNIIGLSVAASYADEDWALSFMFPALIIACIGFTVFMFLVPKPSHVGLTLETKDQSLEEAPKKEDNGKAISFLGALMIPGVIEFSLCLFSAKLVYYVFLFWLPHYIKELVDGVDANSITGLANTFDYGAMIGGIVAGFLSDQTRGLNALICTTLLIPAVPTMYIYNYILSSPDVCPLETIAEDEIFVKNSCYSLNVFLLILLGTLIIGPFSLITTAVSSELGQHESLKGSSKAIATVTAIIDGFGSIGAAVGPYLASRSFMTPTNTIYMLMGCASLAALCLTRLLINDIKRLRRRFQKNVDMQ